MCASKGLVVYRVGLEVSREKGGILAAFQTVVGGLWVMEAPSAATTGGVPGKGCFVPGFIKLEGDEPGFPGQVEKSLTSPMGILPVIYTMGSRGTWKGLMFLKRYVIEQHLYWNIFVWANE